MTPESMLRLALIGNASFSTLSAGACILATDAVARFTGIPADILASLGVELGFFAIGLAFLASRRQLHRPWIRRTVAVVIALDAMWVVGSVALLAAPNPLTLAGQWTVGLVALAVADFAFFQFRGWRGLRRESADVVAPASAVA